MTVTDMLSFLLLFYKADTRSVVKPLLCVCMCLDIGHQILNLYAGRVPHAAERSSSSAHVATKHWYNTLAAQRPPWPAHVATKRTYSPRDGVKQQPSCKVGVS